MFLLWWQCRKRRGVRHLTVRIEAARIDNFCLPVTSIPLPTEPICHLWYAHENAASPHCRGSRWEREKKNKAAWHSSIMKKQEPKFVTAAVTTVLSHVYSSSIMSLFIFGCSCISFKPHLVFKCLSLSLPFPSSFSRSSFIITEDQKKKCCYYLADGGGLCRSDSIF